MKQAPPPGVPPKVTFKKKVYEFDCVAGTGDPIYWRKGKGDAERLHVIVCNQTVVQPEGAPCG